MIAKAAQRMIEERESKFLIPSEIVANVQEDNHLDYGYDAWTQRNRSEQTQQDESQRSDAKRRSGNHLAL